VRLIIVQNSLEHDRMTSLSDTLTVGLVLVLLFGSIAIYLYTRIQQAEQKISLLESILLDLKMSAEIKSYSELPADNLEVIDKPSTDILNNYQPFSEIDEVEDLYPGAVIGSTSPLKNRSPASSVSSLEDIEVTEYKSIIADAVKNEVDIKDTIKVSANYEAMTLKELQTLAKTRGISGAGSMKKNSIIEALKTSDRVLSSIEPGSSGITSNSFLETSSYFQSSNSNAESE
jgi:hypothetical protein